MMFDLTTIQLRNVREKAQSIQSKLVPGKRVQVASVVDAIHNLATERNQTPIEVLDIWSKT